jgi:hypothetical protein
VELDGLADDDSDDSNDNLNFGDADHGYGNGDHAYGNDDDEMLKLSVDPEIASDNEQGDNASSTSCGDNASSIGRDSTLAASSSRFCESRAGDYNDMGDDIDEAVYGGDGMPWDLGLARSYHSYVTSVGLARLHHSN